MYNNTFLYLKHYITIFIKAFLCYLMTKYFSNISYDDLSYLVSIDISRNTKIRTIYRDLYMMSLTMSSGIYN